VSRTILVFGLSMVLSFAFLAACNGDADDDVNGVDDDPIGAADDEDTGPVEDDAALADDDLVVDDDAAVTDDDDSVVDDSIIDEDEAATEESDAVGEDDGEAMTQEEYEDVVDDADAADEEVVIVDDEDDAATTNDEEDDAVTDDDEMANGETVEITLSDHEIEMDSTIEGGQIVLEVTNEGESMHGIAIQQAGTNGNDDEEVEGAGGAFVASMTVAAGETETREIELAEGEYIVFCPVGEHREDHDMETELTVE
jgi:hypothetical protein